VLVIVEGQAPPEWREALRAIAAAHKPVLRVADVCRSRGSCWRSCRAGEGAQRRGLLRTALASSFGAHSRVRAASLVAEQNSGIRLADGALAATLTDTGQLGVGEAATVAQVVALPQLAALGFGQTLRACVGLLLFRGPAGPHAGEKQECSEASHPPVVARCALRAADVRAGPVVV